MSTSWDCGCRTSGGWFWLCEAHERMMRKVLDCFHMVVSKSKKGGK